MISRSHLRVALYSSCARFFGYAAPEALVLLSRPHFSNRLTPRSSAADMRKALPRDKDKKSVVPLSHPVMPEDLEW